MSVNGNPWVVFSFWVIDYHRLHAIVTPWVLISCCWCFYDRNGYCRVFIHFEIFSFFFLFVIFLYSFEGFSFLSCLYTLKSVVSCGKHVHKKSQRVLMCKFTSGSSSSSCSSLVCYVYLSGSGGWKFMLPFFSSVSPWLKFTHIHAFTADSAGRYERGAAVVTEGADVAPWGATASMNFTAYVSFYCKFFFFCDHSVSFFSCPIVNYFWNLLYRTCHCSL